MTFDKITYEIAAEILRAEKKHGAFPNDQIHCAAIVAEECGELVQAAIQYHYENGTVTRMRTEAIQTAAMCVRFLLNLPTEVVRIRYWRQETQESGGWKYTAPIPRGIAESIISEGTYEQAEIVPVDAGEVV